MLAKILEFLQLFLQKACIDNECIEGKILEDGTFRLNIISENPQRLIGKHGCKLFDLQHIFRLIVSRSEKFEENLSIVIDISNYRTIQEEQAIERAKGKIAFMQSAEKSEIELPPMPSYQRRAIHMFILKNHSPLTTESRGEGNERKLIIKQG